ncbi:hypothetical protein Tamer19_22750 [Cupriavidus sp. TA19]|uniref:hypothetical protein n=1 Tax=unclassified Cupriavidus TaxID=2640874 RepID=UPI000E2F8A41|nr:MULTISPECIES: hypothetical protein [unclassified Cupriavidus]BDB28761.1 hypothetical protein CTP10_R61730 [Cupriavidus sp. P-10]GLC92867.1 hypothetical protein Tamer19_22750 [Cupriavidus sp. TA19]
MHPLPFAQVSAARQANLEVLRGVSDVLRLTETAFAQYQTLLQWNLQWVHCAFPGSYECAKQLLAMHRPREILALQTLMMQMASVESHHFAHAPMLRNLSPAARTPT